MRGDRKPVDNVETDQNFELIFNNAQDISHSILRAAPNIQEIREGEIVFMDDGANRRLYTKLNGVLRYVALT